MKTNKILTLIALAVLVLPVSALAVVNPVPNTSGGGVNSLDNLVTTVLSKLWILFAGIAVIMFLFAGIMFLTANGAPEKVATARMAFLWGVVGVVVGIISYSIIFIVGNLIGV